MFQATRDRTARFACEYSRLRHFAIHQAETGFGIPRISRITRDSVGGRLSAMANVLSHALGTKGPVRAPHYSEDSFHDAHQPI